MNKHPYFDLMLHDNVDLETLLGCRIVERTMLHEWPLSFVERLTLADGRMLVHKSQARPTVEPEFLESAESVMLVPARTILRTAMHACTMMDWVEGMTLKALNPDACKALRYAPLILEGLSEIKPKGCHGFPVHVDISTPEKWVSIMNETVSMLTGLIDEGKFKGPDTRMVDGLRDASHSQGILGLYDGTVGLVHGDLKAENIMVMTDEPESPSDFRVLDWQRPLLGPVILDAATLLDSLGCDARMHAGAEAVRMQRLLLVRWYTESAVRWLPGACGFLDGMVTGIMNEPGVIDG